MDVCTAPKLREDLEIIRGMDDHPLVFDPQGGTYHRLTRSAAALLRQFDGTRSLDELSALMAERRGVPAEGVRGELDTFVGELTRSGLLVGTEPEQAPKKRAGGRFGTSMLMPRFVVTRSLPTVLEPVARLLRLIPARLSVGVFAGGGVLGILLGLYAVITAAPPARDLLGTGTLVAIGLMLFQILVHESAHAMVCQVLKVPVRGLGVALLFYFMPLAYVDRTDAYRVRSRGGRVLLALAGPLSDGWFTGAAALLVLTTDGPVAQVAGALLIFQMLNLVTNVNPMLPSDGYAAIEAGFGLVDARGRAFALLKHRLLGRPLPGFLERMPARSRRLHVTYGIVCSVYTVALGYFVIQSLVWSFDLVGRSMP
ncbi:PqqD family peptide modification chaperone [Streptomyces sp.]|uniref:PqqD family peptide modification chaperone n=1 Tax=Streptomyces sp. TaxID=1931 RepID=UPI002811C622|nr:PqqD family peptide modification chaperone [Streptomyces sp.]